MLEDVAANGHEDVISWQPHGRAFRVHKPPEFVSGVMSCYFKQTQYKSFQRQLHMYGFRRITGKGMLDNGAYYHEMFIRGQKHGSLRMTRHKIKGNKKEASDSHSRSDPDFYATNNGQQLGEKLGHMQATPWCGGRKENLSNACNPIKCNCEARSMKYCFAGRGSGKQC
jgi:hypothetical protein